MSNNKVQPQLQKLWNVVSSQHTRETYAATIGVTTEIVKETAVLLWYVVLLTVVGADGLVSFGRKSVHNIRLLLSGLDNSKDMKEIAAESGKVLATASQETISSLLSQARTQLGLPEKNELELPPIPAKQAEPEPVPVSVPEPAAPPSPISSTAPVAAPESSVPPETSSVSSTDKTVEQASPSIEDDTAVDSEDKSEP